MKTCKLFFNNRIQLNKNSSSSRETLNTSNLTEFNQTLLQRYTNPGSTNVIIILLIADTPNDPCILQFTKHINSIKE